MEPICGQTAGHYIKFTAIGYVERIPLRASKEDEIALLLAIVLKGN
jgi:hypothetical protein